MNTKTDSDKLVLFYRTALAKGLIPEKKCARCNRLLKPESARVRDTRLKHVLKYNKLIRVSNLSKTAKDDDITDVHYWTGRWRVFTWKLLMPNMYRFELDETVFAPCAIKPEFSFCSHRCASLTTNKFREKLYDALQDFVVKQYVDSLKLTLPVLRLNQPSVPGLLSSNPRRRGDSVRHKYAEDMIAAGTIYPSDAFVGGATHV